jgi:hypothetical protein
MPIARMPIQTPTELLEEEPLYVNAKQYHRILKRRQARARLEQEGRIPKERPVSFVLNTIISGCDACKYQIKNIFLNRNIFMNLDINMP